MQLRLVLKTTPKSGKSSLKRKSAKVGYQSEPMHASPVPKHALWTSRATNKWAARSTFENVTNSALHGTGCRWLATFNLKI